MSDQFSINTETVEALSELESRLDDSTERLVNECSRMYEVTVEYSSTLGPHGTTDVIEVIEKIKELLDISADSIREIGAKVRTLGGSYQGVIDSSISSKVKTR